MATVVKSAARIKAEEAIYKLMDDFDPSKYNSNAYRALFASLSDKDFKKYMQDLHDEECYISFEVTPSEKTLTLDKIFDICNKRGFKTHKYVMYRENSSSDGLNHSITPYPALIMYMPVKRLQQMVSKKNTASGNSDKINPMTGTVTSDSKAAGLSDTQVFGLITTGQKDVIKELLGPRADDSKSKKQMLHKIEEYGEVSLSDLNIVPKEKQSTATMITFMRAAGIEVKVT